jgi:hypothetical protein
MNYLLCFDFRNKKGRRDFSRHPLVRFYVFSLQKGAVIACADFFKHRTSRAFADLK